MDVNQDIAGSPPSDKKVKESGIGPGFNTLNGPDDPEMTPDSCHREVPVHVTKQVAQSVDAEAPPSNSGSAGTLSPLQQNRKEWHTFCVCMTPRSNY
jgi:hypothetical protein